MEKITKILKTLIPSEDGLFLCDTIEHEGKLWLVPEWIDGAPEKGFSMPARLICLNFLPHSGSFGEADFVLQGDPIPKAVFDCAPIPPELKNRYVVVDNPEIFVETPPTYH